MLHLTEASEPSFPWIRLPEGSEKEETGAEVWPLRSQRHLKGGRLARMRALRGGTTEEYKKCTNHPVGKPRGRRHPRALV